MPDTLNPNMRAAVVEDIVRLTIEKYVYPDIGEKIARHIEKKHEEGGYDKISDENDFVMALTSDLHQVSNDQHWSVMYSSEQATAAYSDWEE